MGVLDEVRQMRNKGISEQQIVSSLRESGYYNPKQIDDALSQEKIKNAVFGLGDSDEMRPSIMEDDSEAELPSPQFSEGYSPKTREVDEQDYTPQEQDYTPQEQGYYPQNDYSADSYSGYSQGELNSDTTMEIAEQIFLKNISKTNKQVEALNDFKTITQTKVENIDERLKRIESMFEKLQIAILGKVGSYGDHLDSIKKEMSMMQDSFGKIVNDIADAKSKKHSVSETIPLKSSVVKKKIIRKK